MRNHREPHGRIFTFLGKEDCDPALLARTTLPPRVRGHMLIALGWGIEYNWVRIVTITSTIPPYSDLSYYLPICDRKMGKGFGIQIRLCADWDVREVLAEGSCVRIDKVYQVPLELLQETCGRTGRVMELQERSWENVRRRVINLGVDDLGVRVRGVMGGWVGEAHDAECGAGGSVIEPGVC